MTGKLQLYDIFSALVPGTLLLCALAAGFPVPAAALSVQHLPGAFAVLALTVLAVFTGHLVQALMSIVEPLLHRTWGGQPSDTALTAGLGYRYLPQDTSDRIREKLQRTVGTTASARSLFLYAMNIAEADAKSRTTAFNGSYAYHRGLLMLSLLMVPLTIGSARTGALAAGPAGSTWVIVGITITLSVLLWHRCRQRAFYYVREVLLTAERHLDSKSAEDDLNERR